MRVVGGREVLAERGLVARARRRRFERVRRGHEARGREHERPGLQDLLVPRRAERALIEVVAEEVLRGARADDGIAARVRRAVGARFRRVHAGAIECGVGGRRVHAAVAGEPGQIREEPAPDQSERDHRDDDSAAPHAPRLHRIAYRRGMRRASPRPRHRPQPRAHPRGARAARRKGRHGPRDRERQRTARGLLRAAPFVRAGNRATSTPRPVRASRPGPRASPRFASRSRSTSSGGRGRSSAPTGSSAST